MKTEGRDGWMKEIWKKKAVGVERKILFFWIVTFIFR
jgi:hypothetical protein